MKLETNYVTSLILPTLLLWLTVSAARVESKPVTRELFGSETHYLDVRWEDQEKGNFKGYFASHTGEVEISGVRKRVAGRWQYEFSTAEGTFKGSLIPVTGRCEPELVYYFIPTFGSARKTQSGKMRAAFCGA